MTQITPGGLTAVASIIFEQLGGRMFAAMTGATKFVSGPNMIAFSLPSGFAQHGINRVMVTWNGRDLYDVEFLKVRGANVTVVSGVQDIYADQLREVFKATTGLDVRL